jgi:hypothetical protein
MAETKLESKKEINLPDDITPVTAKSPRDLVVISIPKMGKVPF